MKVEELSGKVAQGVEEARDRAAEALAGDGESVFRAIARLGDRIEAAEKTIDARVAAAEETFAEGLADVAVSKRTTWPRRVFWLTLGLSAGIGFVVGFPDKVKELRDNLLS